MRKHSRLKRIISRVGFLLLRYPLMLISYFSHRLYMRLYAPLLRAWGLEFTGTPRYIATTVYFDSLHNIALGDRVVISSFVRFLTHDYSITTALIATGNQPDLDIARELPIKVGNNVFIGLNSIIMPGACIGDNVIVGAGSVIRGKIPSNAIVFGNPASVAGDIRSYAEKCKVMLTSGNVRTD